MTARAAPPRAGPATLANCQPLLFHVTALPSASGGTTCDSSDERDGALKARATPASTRQTKIEFDRPLPERQGGQSQRSEARPSPCASWNEHAAAVAVGRLPGRQGQQQHGQELGQPREAEGGRGAGALVQFPADGDGLDLAADAGQDAAGQQQAVIAVTEGRVGVVGFRHGLLGGVGCRSFPPPQGRREQTGARQGEGFGGAAGSGACSDPAR